MRFFDGELRLGAGRVDDADEGEEREVGEQVFDFSATVDELLPLCVGELTHGERQHAQTIRGHGVVVRVEAGATGAHRRGVVGHEHLAAARHHDVGCALHVDAHEVGARRNGEPVDGGHVLRGRVEGNLGDARVFTAHLGKVDAQLFGEDDECAFGRVANQIIGAIGVVHDGVGAEGQTPGAGGESVGCRRAESFDRSGRRVTAARDVVETTFEEELGRGHLVEGEGARLVAADDTGAAESFDCRETFDDGVSRRQLTHADGKGDDRDCRQALGNRCDRKCDGREQHVAEILTTREVGDHDESDDDASEIDELVCEAVELALQRGLLRRRRGEKPGDTADLGAHARLGDDDFATTTGDRRVHERVRMTVANRCVRVDGVGVLFDRVAFAGEGGFVDFEVVGEEDLAVGGKAVARLDENDVARNHGFGRHHHHRAVTTHADLCGEHLPQCVE